MATDYMILTEKKSECDNFAKALGGMKGVFDNHSYQLVHAQGHLLKLAEPDQQVPSSLKDKYSSWKPENMPWDISDFSWRRVPTSASNVKSLLGHIKKVSKDCDAIIIATDSDLTGEGELLAWEIINAIGWQGKVYREYHADESVKAIQKAMTNLKDVSDQQKDGDYLKANLRNRWDFVSIQLTRLATSYARQAGYSIRAINQGRLKSVMIRMVKDQLQAIEDYVRKPYYEAKYKDDQGHLYARKVDSKDEQAVAKIRHQNKHGAEVEANQLISPASVGAVKITDVYQAPKTLLDLSKLDGILSKKGYSSTTIKNVYQQLYEKNYVSYPRTEDKVITEEQFNELVANSSALAKLVDVDPGLLTHKAPRKNLVKSSATHGANRPGSKIPESLDEIRNAVKNNSDGDCAVAIYTLLVKTSLAILGEDYHYQKVNASIAEKPDFVTSFNQPVDYQYKLIYCPGELPERPNPVGKSAMPVVTEGANPKPARPSKEWLYKKLENYGTYGIGTAATRQKNVAELTNSRGSHYLMKSSQKGYLSLTEVGMAAALTAQGTYIADPEITEKLFAAMDLVGQFKMAPEKALKSVTNVVKHDKPIFAKNVDLLKGVVTTRNTSADKIEVLYQGKPVLIKPSWGGHKFTDTEKNRLSAGKTITFKYYKGEVTGQLGEDTFKGHKYVGFIADFNKKK